jgi:hypothetical protein
MKFVIIGALALLAIYALAAAATYLDPLVRDLAYRYGLGRRKPVEDEAEEEGACPHREPTLDAAGERCPLCDPDLPPETQALAEPTEPTER